MSPQSSTLISSILMVIKVTPLSLHTLFLAVAALWGMAFPISLHAQSRDEGRVSISYYAAAATGLSPAMQGTASDIRSGKHYGRYPASGLSVFPDAAGLQLMYRLPESRFGIYVACGWTGFAISPPKLRGVIDIATLELGAECELWEPFRRLSLFGRGEINGSSIGGSIGGQIYSRARYGAGAELGIRHMLLSERVAFEYSCDYKNLNIIGKSFSASTFNAGTRVRERGLNDAPNPLDPADRERVIDVIAFHLGARLIF